MLQIWKFILQEDIFSKILKCKVKGASYKRFLIYYYVIYTIKSIKTESLFFENIFNFKI